MPRKISFLVFPGFEMLDLSGPCAAFNLANESHGANYEIRVVSAQGGEVIERAGLRIASQPLTAASSDETLIATGGPTAPEQTLDADTLNVLRTSAAQANRIASVCTGAFLLASAGLLDGRSATTHWRYAGLLQTRYPAVRVTADRIYVRDAGIWTSAGMTAGIDLALMLIDEDLGSAAAQGVARDMVVSHRRLGGQSQFSAMLELAPPAGRIRDALNQARNQLQHDWSVERLAEVACVSPRHFTRLFVNTTGTTPARAIERLRLEAARPRIEECNESFERIARELGFGSSERMCRSFVSVFGRTPQELRRSARADASTTVSDACAVKAWPPSECARPADESRQASNPPTAGMPPRYR